jgi:hypothetical protein
VEVEVPVEVHLTVASINRRSSTRSSHGRTRSSSRSGRTRTRTRTSIRRSNITGTALATKKTDLNKLDRRDLPKSRLK